MNQINLDQLSDTKIKQLWQAKQAKDRTAMREAEQAALADMGVADEGYWKDAFGNVIEGKKPTPPTVGHYIDANGYIQEGDKPPVGSGDRLIDWLQTVDVQNDVEVREALGPELFFEEHIEDICLKGRLENNGWLVTATGSADYKFRLARSLSREEAITQAVGYAKIQMGPQFKELTDEQIRICQRLAVADRTSAFVFYLQGRLPEHLADRFLELGAAGDELGIQALAAEEKISAIAEESVMNAFYFNNPRATQDFFDYVHANDGGRLWTFALLDSLWNRYNVNAAINRLDQNQPTTEEVVAAAENMTDEELAEALAEARKLRSQSR